MTHEKPKPGRRSATARVSAAPGRVLASAIVERLGVGLDIEDVERFRRMSKPTLEKLLKRLFTDGERRYCMTPKDPFPHIAARFCAKEAVLKALSPFGKINLADIEVVSTSGRAPRVVLHKAKLAEQVEVVASLTHTKTLAAAFAVAITAAKIPHKSVSLRK